MALNYPNTCVLIGLGNIGFYYDLHNSDVIYSHAKALVSHPSFNLLMAIDPSAEKRRDFTQKYNIPAYCSIEDVPAHVTPQIAIIATPTSIHISVLQSLLSRWNLISILCEKPLATSYTDAVSMVELCEKNDTSLFVNYVRRCDPSTQEIFDLLTNREPSFPIKGYCYYCNGAFNTASHLLDLLSFWLGKCSEITFISEPISLLSNNDFDVDFLAKFGQSKIVFQHGQADFYKYSYMEIYFSSGRLIYDDSAGNIYFLPLSSDYFAQQLDPSINTKVNVIKNSMDHYQYNVLTHLDLAIRALPHSLPTGRESLDTLRLLDIFQKPG